MRRAILALFITSLTFQGKAQQIIKRAIPDKLVILTFDDAVLSHYTNVAPLLKKYKFGGTFFIAEFLKPSFNDKKLYLSWEQIGELNKMGFEIANHTRNHTHVNKMQPEQFVEELEYIEQKAKAQKVKEQMVSFAYPGYDVNQKAFAVLEDKDYLFARVGGGRAYDPMKDHPYLIPSFSTSGDNSKQIFEAFGQAKDGKIVVLTVHGVPDEAHPWVNTPLPLLEQYLKYLHDNHYKVVALRDLNKYIDVENARRIINPDFSKTK
jgi:peptidoglycan-N-acetylglucosamine deacetylase